MQWTSAARREQVIFLSRSSRRWKSAERRESFLQVHLVFRRSRIASPWRDTLILRRSIPVCLCLLLFVGCAPEERPPTPEPAPTADARWLISVLAADSLEGRRAGSEGARIAARLIAEQFDRAGLEPAGDSGFFQRVPLRVVSRPAGRTRIRSLPSWSDFDSLPPAERVVETNVIGVLPGSDPKLREEYVLVTAHFDHVGIGRPVEGDSIYNGADDDASGVVGLIEIARALESAPPRRTVLFAAMAGEELGLLGTRWYVGHPAVPLAATVAALNLEMIGRPDTAIGPGRAWLTGYERTTMGSILTDAGLAVDPDPRPGKGFYERSDNIAFARIGIPAHTLSSFGMHPDYHSPDDEVERIHFDHLDAVVGAAAEAVRILADGPTPDWSPGGQP